MGAGRGNGAQRPDRIPRDAQRVDLRACGDAAVAGVVARRLAAGVGAPTIDAAEFGLLAVELASNAVRHGGGGAIWLWAAADSLALLVIDEGEGRAERLEARLASASLPAPAEHGLSAVHRLADRVRFANPPGGGLAVTAWRRWRNGARS